MRYIYTRAANENMDIWDVSPSLVQDIVARVVAGRLVTVRFAVLSETETLTI